MWNWRGEERYPDGCLVAVGEVLRGRAVRGGEGYRRLYWIVLGIAAGAGVVGWGGYVLWRRSTMGGGRRGQGGRRQQMGRRSRCWRWKWGVLVVERRGEVAAVGRRRLVFGSGAVWVSRRGVRLRRAGSGTRPVLYVGGAGRAHLGGGPWVVCRVLRQKGLLGCVRLGG